MEIKPEVQFPQQYDEIYYPGRQAMRRGLYFVGGWFAALGAIGAYLAFTSSPPAMDPVQAALLCGLFVAVGVGLTASIAMVRGRSAIALTTEGLYGRDWLNRVWRLPWDGFEQVSIRERFHWMPRSMVGAQQETAYLVGRFVPEERTTAKVGISLHMHLHLTWMTTPDIRPDPMVSSIIRRAGLVPGEPRPHEMTWVRAGEGGRPSPQIDTDAF